MRRVVCKDCGKHYDYDRDDFCPKCGSYNPPAGAGATGLEQEQLARFGDARRTQGLREPPQPSEGRAAPSPAPAGTGPALPRRTPPVRSGGGAKQAVYRPSGVGAAPEPVKKHASRIESCPACEAPERPSRGKPVAVAVVLVLLLILAANLLPVLLEKVGSAGTDQPGPVGHEVWEEFRVNGVRVTVEDAAWVALDGDSALYRPGFECLAVSVWVTGGERVDNLSIDTPRILLQDGSEIALEDDAKLSRRLEGHGIYSVNLRDYQWEDPLMGEFVFFLPEGTRGEAALCIREYAPGSAENPQLRTEHQVSIVLPD